MAEFNNGRVIFTADDEDPDCLNCDRCDSDYDCCNLCGPSYGWSGYIRTLWLNKEKFILDKNDNR